MTPDQERTIHTLAQARGYEDGPSAIEELGYEDPDEVEAEDIIEQLRPQGREKMIPEFGWAALTGAVTFVLFAAGAVGAAILGGVLAVILLGIAVVEVGLDVKGRLPGRS